MKRAPSLVAGPGDHRVPVRLLRLGQAFRAVGAIEQQVRAQILLDLLSDRTWRIDDTIDDGIGKTRQRHLARVDHILLRIPFIRNVLRQRARRRGEIFGVPKLFTGLPSSKTRNAPSLSSTDVFS